MVVAAVVMAKVAEVTQVASITEVAEELGEASMAMVTSEAAVG